MGCKPPAWRQAQIPWAPPRNAENGIRTLAARMCCAGPGREEIGTFAATECLCLWLIGVLYDRGEVAACSALRLVFSGSRPLCICNYNRGSVVTCYDASLEMCGGRRWDTGNNDLFLQSSCRAVVPQVSIEEHCAKREVLSEGHVNARFYTTSPMLFSFSSFGIGTSLAVHTSSITLQVSSYPLHAICPQPLFPTVTLPVNRRYNSGASTA